jgi:hypothetical protein
MYKRPNPAYLRDMPSVERVMAETKGSNAMDMAAAKLRRSKKAAGTTGM